MELKKREEIVKMLECWSSEYGCTGCPLIDQGCFDCGHIPVEISRSILALIKELTEEIKDLEADYDRVYEQAEADIHGNIADGGTSCHWCAAKTKVDTVRKMQDMFAMHYGTYTNMDTVPVREVFVLLNQIYEEILEEKNDV